MAQVRTVSITEGRRQMARAAHAIIRKAEMVGGGVDHRLVKLIVRCSRLLYGGLVPSDQDPDANRNES